MMEETIQPLVPFLYSLITPAILIGYAICLYHITGRNRSADKLIYPFGIVVVLGLVFHWVLFCEMSGSVDYRNCDSLLLRILMTVQCTLELFFANTIVFKNEVLRVLSKNQCLFGLFVPLYGMAILTSGFAVFHFVSRWTYNCLWLTFTRAIGKTHIFIGIDEASICLANDIMKDCPQEKVIFIDLPNQQESSQRTSIWSVVSNYFSDNKDYEALNNCVVLKAGKGIKNITKWLKQKQNNVYILTDNQQLNISILEALWAHKEMFKCKIYCHAKKEGLINRYDDIADVEDRIKFVDSSYLAVEALKKSDTGAMLPVNYVDIAQDPKTKQRLGYVTSAFNCAIIGFGETGKDALKFLYEYAAFPDEKNLKAPFKCHIFDANLAKELGEFGVNLSNVRSSVVDNKEFEMHPCAVGTLEFRADMSRLVKELNYIVVCLGDDNLNVETALNIVECAKLEGIDTTKKFCIAVKQMNVNKLNTHTIGNANATYGGCIHTFGMVEDIWKMKIISNEEVENDARKFYDSYSTLSNELNEKNGWSQSPSWNERESDGIRNKDYKERLKARRQKAQDISNSLHKTTKQTLCAPYEGLAEQIHTVNVGDVHCTSDNKAILEHLAVCEHLRWEASHMLMGYRPTDGKTDDLRKLHNCIKPYQELNNVVQHYDWLVVKNSL